VFCNQYVMPGLALWADYSGFICTPEHEEQAIPALAARLRRMPWAELELENLLISDRRLEIFLGSFDSTIFKQLSRERGRNRDGIDNDVCPFVALPESFESFQQEKLSANTRQKMRRFMRKVEASEELHITEADPRTYQRDIDILLVFWKVTWASHKGSRIDQMMRKYRTILRRAFESGFLYLPVLWRGETPLGALGSFVDRQKQVLLFKLAGRDENCKDPPPGLVLHGHSISWAIANGLKTYDFLRGNEPYKYSYGASDRRIRNITLLTHSRRNTHDALDVLSVDDVLKQAAAYQQHKQWHKAEAGYRQVLQMYPDHPVAAQYAGAKRGSPSPESDSK
jgi:hypothetical protein